MKIARRPHSIWIVSAAAALCAMAALPAGATERGPLRKPSAAQAVETEARVIVKFKVDSSLMRALSAGAPEARPQHAQALSARMGLSLSDGRAIGARTQVIKGLGLSSRELADRLSAQSDVEYAVVDGRMRALAVTPNDPLYGAQTGAVTPTVGQWYLRAPTSSTIADPSSIVSSINAPTAWALTSGSASVVVAVLDTGVRFDHPDLASKLLPGYDFIHDAATANDGDAQDGDASDPGDFVVAGDVGVVPGCTATDVANSSWHGTQTSGLIGAATDNGVGMAGVGRNVLLLPVRVLGRCGGYNSDIVAGMLWAAGIHVDGVPDNAHPAKVLNMSLGSSGACSQPYVDAVAQVNARGAVVVAAAGNDGLAVGTPANCPGVIAVAGVRHAGTKVGYSDLGPEVAIAAPAGNCGSANGPCLYPLLTTSNSGTTTPVVGAAGATYTTSGADASLGTSFSAPLVAGTAALMFAANPTLTPAQVLFFLKSTARTFPASGALTPGAIACAVPTSSSAPQIIECYCTTSTCGFGLLDAGAAVVAVARFSANIASSAATVAPGASVTLTGSAAKPGSGSLSYLWAITSGATLASFTSATNAATATLLTSGAGNVTVSLTVTDSTGPVASSITLSVIAPPVVTPPATSSGGGGAMELGWLLGWLASVIGVWVVTPRRRAA